MMKSKATVIMISIQLYTDDEMRGPNASYQIIHSRKAQVPHAIAHCSLQAPKGIQSNVHVTLGFQGPTKTLFSHTH